MKILIKESQYHLLVEQSMVGWNQGLTPKQTNDTVKSWSQGNHTVNTILQIATAFIPVVGPFLSAGIGLADASMYYKEGKKTEAGIVAFFSILPGLGKVVGKIPAIAQLGERGMAALGAKIIGKQALTTTEQGILKSIEVEKALIRTEASQTIKSMASNAAKKVSSNPTAKKAMHVFAEKGLEHGIASAAHG